MHPSSFYEKLGFIVWLILLFLSILFYKERAFFMDAGFQLFNLINEESIQIYHYRFVTALPQIIPFFLLKLKAPLWVLGISFSSSYILFFLTTYFILVKYLKQLQIGWALILLFTLISLDTFYHIQSEFYLGLALVLLSFGIILRYPKLDKIWLIPIIVLLLVTIGFSHKLSLLIFLFIWLFFLLDNSKLRHKRYVLLLILFLIVAVVKSVYFTNWYESAKQDEFQANFLSYYPNLLSLPSNYAFVERCFSFYYMLPILLLVVSWFYVAYKKWLKLLLVWVAVFGFILLYNISDPISGSRFYAEVTYLPTILFVVIPFLFNVFPAICKKVNWLPALFVIVMGIRIVSIANNSRTFERCFNWVESQFVECENLETNRLLIKKENIPIDTVLMEWGVPFTSMHLSSLDNPSNAKTIIIMPDFEWYSDKLNQENIFFSPFHKVIEVKDLNNNYYDLRNGVYKELK